MVIEKAGGEKESQHQAHKNCEVENTHGTRSPGLFSGSLPLAKIMGLEIKRPLENDYAAHRISCANFRKSSCYKTVRNTKYSRQVSKPADILRSTPIARDYAKSFTAATGLPVSIEAPGEFHLDSPDLPECCRKMVATSKACEKCGATHTALQGPVPRTVKCFAGLTSSAVPVIVRDETVAYLHTGHAAVNGDADKRHVGAPRLTRGEYEGALRLLELFSRQLADNLPSNVSGAPYPAIDRAARLIRQNPEKPWCLTDLARTAKMHPAYFSEMFRKRFEITLTRFIAGTRVDRARQLLLNTDLRIIEIAFAVGFGSISQFNRIFRAHTGLRPGDLRKNRLPPAKKSLQSKISKRG